MGEILIIDGCIFGLIIYDIKWFKYAGFIWSMFPVLYFCVKTNSDKGLKLSYSAQNSSLYKSCLIFSNQI